MSTKHGVNIYGTNFGDTAMSYYVSRAHEWINYARDSSPGGRNFREEKMDENGERFSDEVRFRDWPDRGFDGPRGRVPSVIPPDDPEGKWLEDEVNGLISDTHRVQGRPGMAPRRISNEGRLYSLSELGNIHDPVMWRSQPDNDKLNKNEQLFTADLKENIIWNIPGSGDGGYEAIADQMWGGGNTLRIGRPEHGKFDVRGKRASQLLDLFHVGTTGTNLGFGTFSGGGFIPDSSVNAYASYDPRDHQPPPTADDATEAAQRPYSDIYPEDIHAQGQYRLVHGHINLNTIPNRRHMEMTLRGIFATSSYFASSLDENGVVGLDGDLNPMFEQAKGRADILELAPDTVDEMARRLHNQRPYYAPSQLADVLSGIVKSIDKSDEFDDVMPEYYSDAMAEEVFARLYNTTTLSSRHFRIFALGEVVNRRGEPIASATRVYEVFMRPERNASGDIVSVTCEILSERDR
ncbi:MAG: hypothetical protein AAF591_21990 [Verrucomicrobiota bacterium]